MIKKGIILAGGFGTRLSPLTKAVNKQLLPIHDKPMIFYPLSIMMLANIKVILMIVNPGQIENFKNLLGNGSRFGIKIIYKVQSKPRGLPDAFNLGKSFIGGDNVALILGDNFFYGQSLTKKLEKSSTHKIGATIFLKEVLNPKNYGVATIRNNKIENIVEKPKKFVSNKAITGLYFFDKNVCKFAKKLKPSNRGELEITDLINEYKKNNMLKYELIGRGAIWSDAGKMNDLTNVSNYVKSVEEVQGIKIACLEEISLLKKWIDRKRIKQNIKFYGNCEYSNYLKKL
ncbi:sugar phosphate nucleotidyltransferase [Candidatus Pelagibacter sp.]|nr:sugar phosphate nucleotidyltransferase [Candidatus Pelagibacter sp.]|tara:strand:+ start:1515 stop:2375 length:861 start_codon:yes stop_codon:yes gene_type:complete